MVNKYYLIQFLKNKMPEFSKKEINDYVRYLDYIAKIRKLENNFKKINKKYEELNNKKEFLDSNKDIIQIVKGGDIKNGC